jgi:hypothetical protein
MGKIVDYNKVKLLCVAIPDADFDIYGDPMFYYVIARRGNGKYSRQISLQFTIEKGKEYGLNKVTRNGSGIVTEDIRLNVHGEWKVEVFRDEDGELRKNFFILVS